MLYDSEPIGGKREREREREWGKRETDDIQRRCVGGVSVWYARHPDYNIEPGAEWRSRAS